MNAYRKWIVLGVFALSAGLSQLLWLNFAPLVSLVEKRYGVSEDMAGLLLLVFPLVYMLLSIPAGALVDRKGYVFSVGLGSVVMAVFAWMRAIDLGYWWLFAAQFGIAVAQPFVVNAIAKLVLDWFEPGQAAAANGIGTVGMFLGMALGMAATPELVDRMGYEGAMRWFAWLSTAVCIAFIALARANPRPRPGADARTAFSMAEVRALWSNRTLVRLFALSFLGLGFFNGLTTWIEPILAPFGISSAQAGMVGAALVVGGIVGAAIIPALSDVARRHRPFLLVSIAVAAATLYPLCRAKSYTFALAFGAAQGFFFLPAFALLLAMCAEVAGAAQAGAATGFLMLLGNAGGVVVILAMEWVNTLGTAHDFGPAVALLLVTLLGALVCGWTLPETHPARRAA